ncbi:MAG: NHLP bacteriocin system secretion protein [Desulfobacterales bacterium]|nr:NHLP bacteriocin system secretion protein [Desulfobacterales bacterium]
MSDPKSLFRKKALERISSPDQLDTLMQVTSPVGWIALISMGVIVFMIILWGLFGTINDKVYGQGILIKGGTVLVVTSVTSGQIEKILVKSGDLIKEGQIVASIGQPGLQRMIQNTKDKIGELEDLHSKQTDSAKQNLRLSIEALNKEEKSLGAANEDLAKQLNALNEKLKVQEKMYKKGLVTESTLLEIRSRIADTEQAISKNNVRKAQISSEIVNLRRQLDLTTESHESRMADLKRELKDLESKLSASSSVLSPYTGLVLETKVETGNLIQPGTDILSLENQNTNLEAVVYIPAIHGKKVKVGMYVNISPSTVKAEEYGFILGRVKSISDFPATPQGMQRVLHNETLVKELTGQSSPIEMIATLDIDESTVSGYLWSSSKGPPFGIFSGTICGASIIVMQKKPIEYVIPYLKRKLGTV